jgi:hypothetical protein
MTFTITVQNDGVDGTVVVTERLNLNESREVFNDVLAGGDSKQIDCYGTPPKDFDWVHHATMTSGGPETVNGGGVLRVRS